MAVPTISGVQTAMNEDEKEVGGRGRSGGRQTVPRDKASQHNKKEKGQTQMRKLLATLMIFFLFVSLSPMVVEAASPCPPEVQAAKDLLGKQVAKSQDVQAPRSLAGARSQDVQAPRSQDVQAPRGQDIQAPRGQDVQAPRGQDIQAPRTLVAPQAPRSQDVQAPRSQDIQAPRAGKAQDVQAPRGQDVQAPRSQDIQAPRAGTTGGTMVQAPRADKARILVNEAEAACKAGDMTKATEKAKAAMAVLQQK